MVSRELSCKENWKTGSIKTLKVLYEGVPNHKFECITFDYQKITSFITIVIKED